MTTARKYIVDVSITRHYHTISKCVRQLSLCGDENVHRKQWIEDRLEFLVGYFAISVSSFSVMDNHLHINVRLDYEDALGWTPEEVMRRWMAIYHPSDLDVDDPKVVEEWIEQEVKDGERVEEIRVRLGNLGWFMKALKEPIARRANREDECTGSFWQARYKSIGILDNESLLITCTYVDLNPLAAGIAKTPESSEHTSIRQRIAHVSRQGKLDLLLAAAHGSVSGSRAAGDIEQAHWLIPIQDRRVHTNAATISDREGLLPTFSLGSYLLLVDHAARLYREGKARLSDDAAGVFERLGIETEGWSDRIQGMLTSRSLRGNYMASNPGPIRAVAAKQGRRHLANLSPQQA